MDATERAPAERRVLGMPAMAFVFAAPPTVWATVLAVGYVAEAWACAAGARGSGLPGLDWISVTLLLLAAGGVALILFAMRLSRDVWRDAEAVTERAGDPAHRGRRGFVAFAGLFWGGLFLVGTLFTAVVLATLGCEGVP